MRFPTDRPVVIINYKAYPACVGKNAVAFTHALERAAEGKHVTLAVATQAADILRVSQAARIAVLAEHVDSLAPGNGTGSTLVEAAADAGAVGSLVNHAEKRLTLAEIGAVVTRLRASGLASVVCSDTAATTRGAAALRPDFVAVEPPELIGGTVSVTKADPGIVRDSVKLAKEVAPDVRVLCGAGVQTGEDLAAALKLGADGVLLASAVTKAKDPGAALAQLLTGLA
ncbi:MAG TPA: triose-phosphate isomerase [Candidatus Thermoplasmatota archaeon]|nr:triose-phosphate isomerase [Candidatus Thermoplasmatota archaeon]